MSQQEAIKLFDSKRVRTVWDDEKEKWYFSIVDVIAVLTDSPRPRKYWNALKTKLEAEGSEVSQNMGQLKMTASDGKQRLTDVADIEQVLRLIQSIRTRKELTDEWERSGVHDQKDFAVLTNILTKAWSGMTTGEYKKFKGLTKEDLRDNMNTLELALNTLAEAATTEISRSRNPKTMAENKMVAKSGGDTAKLAREDIERKTGRSVVSSQKASDYIRPIEDTEAKELKD